MASISLGLARRGDLCTSTWDTVMLALAAAQGVVLVTTPTVLVIALGLWWNSNTISHNFIHRPFFRRRWANLLFGAYLSVLLGIPQALWRHRHLAHHAGVQRGLRFSGELVMQTGLVLSLWAALAARAPAFFFSVYLPGYITGLGLCALHGYYEHARGTTSHYGRLYNLLFFNDGYHAEHHAKPGLHWTRLPESSQPAGHTSAWPASLRWMEAFSLESLERLVLRSRVLQRFVLRTHARAFREQLPSVERIAIVGGGLFPRTALILEELLPSARITIIDANRANLDRAHAMLRAGSIEFVHAAYRESDCAGFDLIVIPLSFDGDREAIYRRPPAPGGHRSRLALAQARREPRCVGSAAQTHQPGAAMKAASLLLVFVLAKLAVLAGHHVPFSWWSPIAWFWQDAMVVLAFAAIELCLGHRQRIAWVIYAGLALYAAINIPVCRALSTPLTLPMLRAARGALSDSMWYYVTSKNVLLLTSVLAVAALTPRLFRRVPKRPLVAALVLCALLGPVASARVDALGLERNAWTALIASALPRMQSRASAGDWRATNLHSVHVEDLSRFRGVAAGRNIVLVSLESTAAQYLGLYGADPDVMPNLTELARTAIVFDNAYAVYPESIKGLFSILCSAYPAFDSAAEEYASVPCRSVAEILSRNGYRTGLFHSGRFSYLGMEAIIRNRGFDTLEDAGDIGGNHNSSFGVDEPSTVARILSWVGGLPKGQRFFVTWLPIAGHHPYETPEAGPFPEHDEFGRYRNALHYADASLGTLMRGLDRNTLWIVLGDHGEAFGQHEGNYGHTFQVYDENVRVPFLVAAPGVMTQQVRSRGVVSLVDTAPTLLDVVGVRVPESYQGRSMLEFGQRMALCYADYSRGLLGLRDGPWKFIYELDSGRSKLFDVEKDPEEKVDVSERHGEQTRWYTQVLRSWSAAQKQLLRAAK